MFSIQNTLTSFFYDLVKEVPAGQLNKILCNTIIVANNGEPMEVEYSDEELRKWACAFADQLIQYHTKFSTTQLRAMGFTNTLGCEFLSPNMQDTHTFNHTTSKVTTEK